MKIWKNPILEGFYPDPSICKVGDRYYLVNSTFAFYPGIPIWSSTDLTELETDWKCTGASVSAAAERMCAFTGYLCTDDPVS